LASRVAAHQALIDQHSCFILATNALDTIQLPPHAVLDGYKTNGVSRLQTKQRYWYVTD